MKINRTILIFFLVFSFLLAVGCGKEEKDNNIQAEKIDTDKDISEMTFAIVTKSEGNLYNEKEAQGFQKAIENAGAKCVVAHPKAANAKEQVRIVRDLVDQNVDAITIAANDADALVEILDIAKEKGILITTLDSNVHPDYSRLFINQVDTELLAKSLLDAVYDIAGGEGQWAILSASSMATNQTAWINAMRTLLSEDEKYKELELVEIVYGDDESQLSKDQARALLQTYQDLKVICAPTTVGSKAAAEVLSEENASCKLTGLGIPSEMADYVKEDKICPCIYLWDSEKTGELAAYAALALKDGTIEGVADEILNAGDLGVYTLQDSEEEGVEIIAGSLIRFDKENIDNWKDIM